MACFTIRCLLVAVLLAPVKGGVTYPDCTNGPLKSNLVCDQSASPEARATALVGAMSNNDKLANLVKFVGVIAIARLITFAITII